MKTLITGATGFVGSAVLRRLLASGHDVRVLVRPGSDRRNLRGLECEVVFGDLRDLASLAEAARGCRALFHVAADYRLWVPDPATMYATNVEGTRNILQVASRTGVERVVYTSSVATLGCLPCGGVADESTKVSLRDMVGHYKRSKFLAEETVRTFFSETSFPVIIVNPSTPIGPGDVKPTPTGRMVLQAAAGRMPAYVDTGLNFVHVDDVARGHLLAFERGTPGERYVLGGCNMTLKALLDELATITGRPAPRFRVPHRLILPIAYAAEALAWLSPGREPFVTVDGVRLSRKKMFFSDDKARRELGHDPRPVRSALEDAVHWFQENGYLDERAE
jgi:dihydroflavonol-4-reductase